MIAGNHHASSHGRILALAAFAVGLATTTLVAQQAPPWTAMNRGSDNIEVLGHLPLGPDENLADMDIEQELGRPYAPHEDH